MITVMGSCWVIGLLLLSSILRIDGDSFKIFPGTVKVSEAISFCQNQGMVLPLLKSPLAQRLAVAALPTTPEWEYWIGLDYFTGDFRWGDNSLMCWENWFVSEANEPNMLETQKCVAMRGRGSVPGAWLTKDCSQNRGIICQERQPTQDGTFSKLDGVIPTGTSLSSLPVWTESACVLHCDITKDCHMATYHKISGQCHVYNCRSNVTNSPGRVTWINQFNS